MCFEIVTGLEGLVAVLALDGLLLLMDFLVLFAVRRSLEGFSTE